MLTQNGCVLSPEFIIKIRKEGMRKIKRKFTITTMGHNNIPKIISSFKKIVIDGEQRICIPRFGGFLLQKIEAIDELKNNLPLGEDIKIQTTNLHLTPNQESLLDHLIEVVYDEKNTTKGSSSCIVQMDPGYGKTYLAMGLINNIKKKTFIIVPNTYLLNQWVEALEIAFPCNYIGLYYGKKKLDGDIIVSVLNSALNYPLEEYAKCGLIIYDEVHMYCSSKSSAIFNVAQSTRCLGITATPAERTDKFDKVATWSLGEVIRADSILGWSTESNTFSTVVKCIRYNGHPDHTRIMESKAGIVSVPLLMNQIQDDPYRNNLIIAHAIELYEMGRNIFIFSDRREHLLTLAKLLDAKRIEYEAPEIKDDIKTLMGGSTKEDIETAKSTSRVILTTYQYSGTGVSINKMDSLILATPRKSNMKQILGRIYRLSGNNNIVRHIIDIIDNRLCLKSQFYTRKKTYIGLNATIVVSTVKWQSYS